MHLPKSQQMADEAEVGVVVEEVIAEDPDIEEEEEKVDENGKKSE